MRSRYSAYALGLIEYIVITTHPAGSQYDADALRWRASLADFCRASRFVGLQILETGPLAGTDAFVAFRARLLQDGADASFGERSRFRQLDGVWKYLDGEPIAEAASG
jgi:SEC-C motif-containing protein